MAMAYLDPKQHFAIKNRLRSCFEGHDTDDKVGDRKAPGSPRTSWQRQVFSDVGNFLFGNALDPTPNNYDLAYQYCAANNARLVAAIRAEIGATGALDADAAERIFSESGGPLNADALSDFAERMEAQAHGLTKIARQSAGDVSDFSSALERECASGGEMAAIVGLTQAMVSRARNAELQLRQAQKQLSGLKSNLVEAQRAADVDPLTELPNRRAFKRDLERMIETARNERKPLSLAFCDIDHFKTFNDQYGHETGDRVLRYVAAALARAFDKHGLVGRFGGEEFVVALPAMTLPNAHKAVDAAREQLGARHLVSATDNSDLGSVAFSAGVTTFTDGDGSAELLRRADEALYRAKASGRNCVVTG